MQNYAKNRPKRPYRYGTFDIAKATNKSKAAVQKDRSRGKFVMTDLLSLAVYIMRCQAKLNRPRKRRKRKALPSVPPNQSESTS